ncbi:MAG: hypothetical protein R2681_18195 [Pyrinomonadaceae bacterium]
MRGIFIKRLVYLSGLIFALALSSGVFAQTKLPASSIKTVYITPLSHYDFGFVEPPEEVRGRAARHIDEVIRVAQKNPNFKWTIESVWQVNEWLKRQKKPTSVLPKDKARIGVLMNLIKSGRITLSTSWGSMHTDFMGAEELNRLTYDYAKLERTYGVSSDIALLDDVPGHPTSLPSVLAGSGTKYLVTGANLFISQATSLAPGKVPFYWESPDGSKVLTWVSQGTRGGYVEALTDFYLDPYSLDPYTDKTPFDMFNPELAGKKKPIEVMEIGVTELLNRYNKAGYKFDAVMAMYAHDFIEPTDVENLDRAVKLWNRTHKEVQLKIATPDEFLKYIERKYASQLETHRGEWSGLWSEAKTQSPQISALARYTHDHAPAAEILWSGLSMTRNLPYPVGNFSGIYDLVLTYDEHSGAGNNGWIQLNSREPLEEQNRQYVEYMNRSTGELDFLLRQGIKLIAQPTRYDAQIRGDENTWNVLVYNGLSWNRNDVVKLEAPGQNLRISEIRDSVSGGKIEFDINEEGRAVFVARDIPSLGYRVFSVKTERGPNSTTLKTSSNETEIENSKFRVRVSAEGNVQSIFDIGRQKEIVNPGGEMHFNELLRVEGQDASKIPYPFAAEISVRKGKQMSQIVIERKRSAYPESVITIYEGLDRAEIQNRLDSKKLPFVGGSKNWHDSYYFAFPFNVSKDNLKVKRGGQKWFDTLPDDYLPGARTDAVTTQHLIGMTDGKDSALLAHRQAFHWVYPSYVDTKILPKGAEKGFPAMFTGKFPLPEATIYSRAVRRSNQADTHDLGVINMLTVEPGLPTDYVFDYAVAADGTFNDVTAWTMGANFNVPLRAQYIDRVPQSLSYSFFKTDKPNVQIVDVKSLSDSTVRGEVSAAPLDPQVQKVFVIRLQEFSGKSATVRIDLPVKIKSAEFVNLNESKTIGKLTKISPLIVEMKPFETKTIKFEVEE